jgi:hypothetical protein
MQTTTWARTSGHLLLAIAVSAAVACSNSDAPGSGGTAGSPGGTGAQAGASGTAGTSNAGKGGTSGAAGGTSGSAGSSGHAGTSGSGGKGGSAGTSGAAGKGSGGTGGSAGTDSGGTSGASGSSGSEGGTCDASAPVCNSIDGRVNGTTCCQYCDCQMANCSTFATRVACIDYCKSLTSDKLCCRMGYCKVPDPENHCVHSGTENTVCQ